MPQQEPSQPRTLRETIERIPGLVRPDDCKGNLIVGYRGTLDKLMADIEQAREEEKIFIVGVGANPGSGKTRFSEDFEQEATRGKRSIVKPKRSLVVNNDFCIGNERNSKEREKISSGDCSGRYYNKYYMRREMLRDVLGQVVDIAASGKEGEVTIPDAYLRDEGGTFGKYLLKVPKKVELIIVDGVFAVEELNKITLPDNFVKRTVFIYVEVLMSLLRASVRDVTKGKTKDIVARLKMHANQYFHIVKQTNRSMKKADYICQRFADEEEYMKAMMEKHKRKMDKLKDNAEITTVIDALIRMTEEALEIFGHLIPPELLGILNELNEFEKTLANADGS